MIKINTNTSKTIFKVIKYALAGLLSLVILGILCGALLFFYYVSSAPKLSDSTLRATSSSLIYDNQDNLIADLGAENRESIDTADIPLDLVNAITAIEDQRFFKHKGIDIYRIMGSVIHNLTSNTTHGGSTLDQQLIKLAYFSTDASDQNLKRKAQEAWLALQMEQQYTKEEILTFYINKVFMGNGNYGMLTAAKSYYGKDLKDLSIAQVALLAGIPQAPSSYSPYTNPELAKERRDIVLSQMLRYDYITQEQYNEAVETAISDGLQPLVEKFTYDKTHDNYLTQVIEEVSEKTGLDLFTAGLKVYTNLDQDIQQQLWDVTNTYDYIGYPDDDFQVATTIIDVTTGRVVAQLGGRNQDENTSFGTNQAVLTDRDWGSTVKPITDYAPAFEYGVYTSTGHQLNDSPYNWPGTSTPLYNWDKSYYGWMPVQRAIQYSRNVPAVQALESVGLDNALNFLNGLGIDYPELYYSNAISSNTSVVDNAYGMSSEKVAAAYAAFANGGTYYKPQYVRRIEFNDDSVIDYEPEGNYAMSETTAYMMTDMMKTVMYSPGTGQQAYIEGVYQAGKSGTSDYTDQELATIYEETGLSPNYVGMMAPDELFVGYNPQYSVAVWTGYKNRLTPLYGNNLTIAKYIYRNLMLYLVNTYGNYDFTMPEGVYSSGGFLHLNGTSTSSTTPQQQDTSQWTTSPTPTESYTSYEYTPASTNTVEDTSYQTTAEESGTNDASEQGTESTPEDNSVSEPADTTDNQEATNNAED